MVSFWIVFFVVLLIIELLTMGLTTIWFSGGALISALVASLGGPVWLQILVFIIVSILLLFFTRPIAMKYFNKSRTRTNADRAIGEQAIVSIRINNLAGEGRVNIKGVDWNARSENKENQFEVGQTVTVLRIEGVTAIVD